MTKYLLINGDDYAATIFEQDFKGDRLGLWNKSNEAGKTLTYEDEELYFDYKALELDEDTVEQMRDGMDYDHSKHENYVIVREK